MPTPPRPGPPRPGAPRPGGPRPLGPAPGASRPSAPRPAAPKRAGTLLDRVKQILFQPSATWETIAGEFTTTGQIYKSYVIPLAALPAVCQIIGSILWGKSTFFGSIKIPPVTAVQAGATFYVLLLLGVFLLALIINALAPTFGGTANRVQAIKIAAYSATASWLAGVFVLVPGGGWLRLLGAYSLYLMYGGLVPVMKADSDRAAGYAVVVGVAAVVLYLIIDAATMAFLPQPRG
jgi:hypothetical protein